MQRYGAEGTRACPPTRRSMTLRTQGDSGKTTAHHHRLNEEEEEMKHKLLALAVAGAVGMPGAASADSAKVEIYGTLVPFIENTKTSGATDTAPADIPNQRDAADYTGAEIDSRTRIISNTSNIGFRGSYDLREDLEVVWQVESGLQVDSSADGPSTIASRNSRIGLSGDWGTAFVGQWDTPYKWATLPRVNPLKAGYVFDYNLILNNPGFNVPGTTTQRGRSGGAADAAFDRRQGNSIQYWTPKVGGFYGRIAYSVNESKGADDETNPEIWSFMINYDIGRLSLRYAYEQHDDYFGLAQLGGTGPSATNPSSKDMGHKFVAIYSIADTKLVAAYDMLKYTTDESAPGAVTEYERNAYYLLVEQTLGKHHIWASYGAADEGECSVNGGSCSTNGLGANQFALGYLYRFDKTTDLFAGYYKLTNDDSASYASFPPIAGGGGTSPGADTTGIGVGILYSF